MKKLWLWCKENILFISSILLLMFIPLYPKFPLLDIKNTWVYVRIEDFLVLGALFIWVVLAIKRRISLKTPITIPVFLLALWYHSDSPRNITYISDAPGNTSKRSVFKFSPAHGVYFHVFCGICFSEGQEVSRCDSSCGCMYTYRSIFVWHRTKIRGFPCIYYERRVCEGTRYPSFFSVPDPRHLADIMTWPHILYSYCL